MNRYANAFFFLLIACSVLFFASVTNCAGSDVASSSDGSYEPVTVQFDRPVSLSKIPAELERQGYKVPSCMLQTQMKQGRSPQVEIIDDGVGEEADVPNAAAISPDGNLSVTSFFLSGNVGFKNLTTYEEVGGAYVGTNPTDVDILPSGTHALVTVYGDNQVVAVNLTTFQVDHTVPVGLEPVSSAIAPDGSRAIVMNSGDNSASIIELTGWTVEQTVTNPEIVSGIFTVSWNTIGRFRYEFSEVMILDDNQTAVAGTGPSVAFIDLVSGNVNDVAIHDGTAKDLAVTRDGNVLACGASNYSGTNDINLYDLTQSPPTHMGGFGIGDYNYNTNAIVFSADGSLIAVTGYPTSGGYTYLQFFDTTTYQSVYMCPTHMGGCGGMAVSPDGNTMIASGYRTLFVDMSGSTPSELGSADAYNAEFMAASPAGAKAITGTSMLDENCYIWDYSPGSYGMLDMYKPGPMGEGDCPKHVSMSPDGATAYISGYASDSVSFLDMTTRTVVESVEVGDRAATTAITPDGSTLMVCNYEDTTVSIIDTATRQVVATLASKRRPGNCIISADGTRAYAVSVGASPNDYVSVYNLDGASSTLVSHIDLGVNLYGFYILGGWTPNPALTPDGNILVIPGGNPNDPSAVIIDTQTLSVVKSIDLNGITPDMPYFAAVSPNGLQAVVTDGDGMIHFIDLAGSSSSLAHSMCTGPEPFQAFYSVDGTHLFVADLTDENIVVIDTSTYNMVQTIDMPGSPEHADVSGNTLFVSCAVSDINPSFNPIYMNGPASSLMGTYEREYYGHYIGAAEFPFGAVTNCPGFDKLSILFDTDPQPTPTSMPPTATPTVTPEPTATPEPTVTPTPTQSGECSTTGVRISMPATIFNPGDLCNCHALVCNADGSVLEGYPLFVILNVFGDLFFAPSFDPGFDSYLATYPSFAVGLTDVEVLPDFFWPANSGDIVGVEWIAALTNPEITDIYGEWDIYEFGWTN